MHATMVLLFLNSAIQLVNQENLYVKVISMEKLFALILTLCLILVEFLVHGLIVLIQLPLIVDMLHIHKNSMPQIHIA